MRIAATADLHFTPQRYAVLRDQLSKIRDDADLLVLAGDLTNYGQPAEMEPLVNEYVAKYPARPDRFQLQSYLAISLLTNGDKPRWVDP